MKRTDLVSTEGANLAFDVQGSGEALLFIPGAGGDAGVYGPLGSILSDGYTVITYDRRCNARSNGDTDAPLDIAQQARDAVAVLRAAGHERALVFGNSGGANIALQLASDHPGSIALLAAHEPPAIALLSDEPDTMAFVEQVHQTSQTQGAPAAMRLFASRLVGFGPPPGQPGGLGGGPLGGAPGGPPGASPNGPPPGPPGGRPGGLGQAKDMSFFFSREYLPITLFRPDLAAIRAAEVPIVVLAGDKSGDAYYVRSARKVAEALGCQMRTVPGNHLAFLIEPAAFAAALRAVLASARNP